MNKLKEILRYHIEGKSKREISKRTELSRNTVEKYLLVFESHPLTYKELVKLSDSELHCIDSPRTKIVVMHCLCPPTSQLQKPLCLRPETSQNRPHPDRRIGVERPIFRPVKE